MTKPGISRELLEESVNASLAKVLATMLDESVNPAQGEEISQAPIDMPNNVGFDDQPVFVGSVGFVGEINGVVYLYFSESMMLRIAERITGMGSGELSEEIVLDVCGEMANVFGGGFKNTLADIGHSSTLTIPTVLNGRELYISTIGVSQYLRFSYPLLDGRIAADLALANFV